MRLPRFPFRRRSIEQEIEACIRAGTGLRQEQWLWTEGPIGSDDLASFSDAIVEWCVRTMGSLRRPYGIDQVALSVACAHPGRPPLASVTFGVFRPLDFYHDDGPRQQLESFVRGLDPRKLNAPPDPIRFAAALFSWGEIAKATVFSDEG